MRELKSIKVSSISLVPKAKNNLPVYFPVSDMIELETLAVNSADGMLTVFVFDLGSTFLPDCLVAPDLLRNMAHAFLRSGAKLEKHKSRRSLRKRDAAVVESFIVQPGDSRYRDIRDHENKVVDVTGAWAIVIELFDKGLRLLYRGDRAWNGVSIFADAVFDKKPQVASATPVPLKLVMSRSAAL